MFILKHQALRACGQCQQVYYCCPEHQLTDWVAHRANCKPLIGPTRLDWLGNISAEWFSLAEVRVQWHILERQARLRAELDAMLNATRGHFCYLRLGSIRGQLVLVRRAERKIAFARDSQSGKVRIAAVTEDIGLKHTGEFDSLSAAIDAQLAVEQERLANYMLLQMHVAQEPQEPPKPQKKDAQLKQ